MKVLTIREPWASLIITGYKTYEFRSWKTNYRGKILIHSGLNIENDMLDRFKDYNLDYVKGAIIGEAELLAYDDYAGKRLNHQKSQRKFYSNSPYQIIMSFEEEQEIVQLVSKMAKNRTEVS